MHATGSTYKQSVSKNYNTFLTQTDQKIKEKKSQKRQRPIRRSGSSLWYKLPTKIVLSELICGPSWFYTIVDQYLKINEDRDLIDVDSIKTKKL
jgi:hypothetical protein